MKNSELQRVIEEICILLQLDAPSTAQVIYYHKVFSSSETHQFKTEATTISMWAISNSFA